MAEPRFAVRSVAIIGAGSSGLVVARYFQAQGAFDRIVVYEQRSRVGGIWNYSARPPDQEHVPQETPYQPPDAPLEAPPGSDAPETAAPEFPTALYDDLYVNIPHPLMGFTDLPIKDVHEAAHPGVPLVIYPQRQTIQEYLERYADDVRHLIRFCTKVDDVRLRRRPRETGGASGEKGDIGGEDSLGDSLVDSWEVHSSDTRDPAQTGVEVFDAVVVAQGHYNITFMPAIANIAAFHKAHPGVITHSKRYRNAQPFRGKRVVVVGNAASGLDIGGQINDAGCQRPLYLSVHTPTDPENLARLVGAEELPAIEAFLVAERGVRLADGRELHNLDAVVFCTGYLFSLPFLEKKPPPAGETTPEGLASMLSTGRRIHRLYDDLFHIDHPTLAFMGLPMKVVPFSTWQAQAAILARTWANVLALPSTAEMDAWERATEAVRGPTFHVWPQGADGAYINATYARIVDADRSARSPAAKLPPRWSDWLLWMRKSALLAKGRFEDGGRTATSLDELGLVYDGDADALGAGPHVAVESPVAVQ